MAEHYSVRYTIYEFYVNGKIIFLAAFFNPRGVPFEAG
jgi:hypothetical protein